MLEQGRSGLPKKPFLHEVDDEERPFIEGLDNEDKAFVLGLESRKEPLIIKTNTYKNKSRISLRYHYFSGGKLHPGRRGVEIPTEMIGDVYDAIRHLGKLGV